MLRRTCLIALAFVLFAATGADAARGRVALLDPDGLSRGFVTTNLPSGVVTASFSLATLPASVGPAGSEFEATLYKAYLLSSTDAAVEIPLASVYPNKRGKARVNARLRGDVSGLGLDRFVVVAYSKDGLNSLDVLTGTLSAQ